MSNFFFILVDGNWSPWSIFGQCTKSCGGGVKHRIRKCDNPAPANGGKNCQGPSKQSLECNTFPCPGKYPIQKNMAIGWLSDNLSMVLIIFLLFQVSCFMHLCCKVNTHFTLTSSKHFKDLGCNNQWKFLRDSFFQFGGALSSVESK